MIKTNVNQEDIFNDTHQMNSEMISFRNRQQDTIKFNEILLKHFEKNAQS